ncbi:MAG: M14 family zinc carboxypeptidase, partial [Pseudomonadota bacterium]
MRPAIFALIALCCVFLIGRDAQAAPIDAFKIDGVAYNDAITTPDAFLGHGLGDQPVRHDMMVGYLRLLAQQSPRLTVETIGRSHEGRPILFFAVTSPDNHARLEAIRTAHVGRLTGEAPAADPDAAADDDAPAVVWLNYG